MANAPISRRTFLALAAAAPAACATSIVDPFAALEKESGGRLGVCIFDTATGNGVGHRMDERFAMCSTFKMVLAAAILRDADRGKLELDTFIPYTEADMVMHAPVTEASLAKGGMTIRALAEAAQKQSDNPAANLLLKQIGGPAGLTRFLRDIGDKVTRIDRYEPEMNRVKPGDERDTTSPRAMAETAARILTGDVLAAASRQLLVQWTIDTTTGKRRIRAGLPNEWRAGDKTGTAFDEHGAKVNDVAIVWPPGKPPIVIAGYFNTLTPAHTVRDEEQAVLATVGSIAATWRT